MKSEIALFSIALATLFSAVNSHAGCLDDQSPSCIPHNPDKIYFVGAREGSSIDECLKDYTQNIVGASGGGVYMRLTWAEVSKIEVLECATFPPAPETDQSQ